MACHFTFKDKDGKEITVVGKPAMQAYLAEGGLEHLFPGKEFPWSEVAIEPAKESIESYIDYHQAIDKRIVEGDISASELKAEFEKLVDSRDVVIAELSKLTIDRLKSFRTGYMRPDAKKKDYVKAVYKGMLADFKVSDDMISYSVDYMNNESDEQPYIKAVRKFVDKTTDDDIKSYADNIKKARAERELKLEEIKKGIENPVTLEDYTRVLRSKMESGLSLKQAYKELTPEQRAQYDDLFGNKTRVERKAQAGNKSEVKVTAQTTSGDIVETKHTKTGEDLFVVKTAERVERDVYNEWNATAKKMGGWYSSFRGTGAVPGFQFKTKENAEAFLKYIGGDIDQAKEAIQVKRDAYTDDKAQSAVERLNEMAGKLDEKADESLGRDRKANTTRRAGQAARAEATANADKAMAQTMRNIAQAIEAGKANFLDRVRQKTQVELMQGIVNTAQYDKQRELYPSYADQLKHQGEKPDSETASYVEFPSYTAFRSDLAGLGRALSEIEGTKKLGKNLLEVADDVNDIYLKFAKENLDKLSSFTLKDSAKAATFKSKSAAEEAISRSSYDGKAIVLAYKRGDNRIILSPSEAIKRGIWKGNDERVTLSNSFGAELVEKLGKVNRRGNKISIPWQFENAYEKQKRLSAMGIEKPAELRAAIREFISLQQQVKEPDKIKEMERAMIGRANDGLDFFPTPAYIADEMVQAADIKEGMFVLEPSAGMGHIAERIREAGVEPDVVELSSKRKELLEAKGFNVVGSDFMDVTGNYDRIIMNPPFSDRRDMAHVQHAYDLLNPGGRLVAIMGEGVFFGSDKKAQDFRTWLEEHNGTDEKLDEGTFKDPSLPVTTGVNARLIVVDKPVDAIMPKSAEADKTDIEESQTESQDVSNKTPDFPKVTGDYYVDYFIDSFNKGIYKNTLNSEQNEDYANAARLFLSENLADKVKPKGEDGIEIVKQLDNIVPKPVTQKVAKIKDTFESISKAMLPFMGKGDTRYYLNGIAIDDIDNKLIASNGHTLAIVNSIPKGTPTGNPHYNRSLEADHPSIPRNGVRNVYNRYAIDKDKSTGIMTGKEDWIDGKFPAFQKNQEAFKDVDKYEITLENLAGFAKGMTNAAKFIEGKYIKLSAPITLTDGKVSLVVASDYLFDAVKLVRGFGYESANAKITPQGVSIESKDGKIQTIVMAMRDNSDKLFKPYNIKDADYAGDKYLVAPELSRNRIDQEAKLSQSRPKLPGSTVAQVQDMLPAKVKKLSAAGKLVVVQSVQDLPASLFNKGAAQQETLSSATAKRITNAQALYFPKGDQIFLVADSLNKKNLLPVLSHELLHRSFQTDQKLKAATDKFDTDLQIRFNLALRGKGTKIELDAAKRVIAAKTPQQHQLEEFKAHIVEQYLLDPQSITGKLKRIIADFIAAIRVALVRAGLDFGMVRSLSPSDLFAMSGYGANVDGISNQINDNVLQSAKQSGYEGDSKGEAFEWLRAVAKGLDMSQEARMQRARDMGFDTDKVWYHGTGSNFNEFKHNSREGLIDIGFHFGSNYQAESRLENTATRKRAARGNIRDIVNEDYTGMSVIPAILLTGESLRLLDAGTWSANSIATTIDMNGAKQLTPVQRKKIIALGHGDNGASRIENTKELAAYLQSIGFKSIIYKNTVEGGGDSVVVFNPNQIRSIFAAFDPDFSESPNLLASTKQLLAPNGEPSNLNQLQWEQVRTPEFKKWFGDWENDPENASKVVDENGEPLAVFHGTDNDFTVFNNTLNKKYGDVLNTIDGASFFTDNYQQAEHFGSKVMQSFLNIRNPVFKSASGEYIDDADTPISEAIYEMGLKKDDSPFSPKPILQDKNHDGVINKIGDQGYARKDGKFIGVRQQNIYVTFNPNQIKSATDNTGEFNQDNPDIRFSMRDSVVVFNPNQIRSIFAAFDPDFSESPNLLASTKQLLAPNGEPSNLNQLQWEQVRTPEFKKWFGDWENDAENASKVIDENGEPLPLFHATNSNVVKFDLGGEDILNTPMAGSVAASKAGVQGYISGPGIWMTDDKINGLNNGKRVNLDIDSPNVMQLFANFKNPLMIRTNEERIKFQDKYAVHPMNLPRPELVQDYKTGAYKRVQQTHIDFPYRFDTKQRSEIIRDGYDGIVLALKDDPKEFIALKNNQVKSAIGNTGEFNQDNPDIRFSMRDSVDEINNSIREAFSPRQGKQSLGWLAGLFQRNHLIDFVAKELPMLETYKTLSQEKDNTINKAEREIAEHYEEMKNSMTHDVMNELGRVQGLATRLKDFDPAKFDDSSPTQTDINALSRDEKAVYQDYKALPDDAKKAYKMMREDYKSDLLAKKSALIQRLNAFPIDRETKAEIIKQIELHFDQAIKKGVYFPLSRNGDTVVTADKLDDDGNIIPSESIVEFTESGKATDKLMAELKERGYKNRRVDKKAVYIRSLATTNAANNIAALATKAIADLKTNIQQQGADDILDFSGFTARDIIEGGDFNQLLSDFNQQLIDALPDTSYRKHFIHRKGTLGYSTDTLRAYAGTRTSAAKNIASLLYDHKIYSKIQDAKDAIKEMSNGEDDDTRVDSLRAVLNELELREERLKNASISQASQILTSLGFMGALGFNVASAAVNMLQVPGVTLPELSGKHGFTKAAAEINKAYKLLFNKDVLNKHSGFDLSKHPELNKPQNAPLRAALIKLNEIGKIDLTLTHEAISMGQNPSYSDNAVTRTVGGIGRYSGYLFHVAEALNRQVTGIAAFNLAYRKNGGNFDEAFKDAVDVIDRTQFDYSQSNRARYMMSDTARVLTLFKSYALGISYYIGRNVHNAIKGETPEIRLAARKMVATQMAMTFATSGLFGLPIGGEALAVLGGVAGFKYKGASFAVPGAVGGMLLFQMLLAGLGADDEDDVEVQFRNWLTDNFDQTTAEWIVKGPARLLPMGDISGRTGLSDIWWRPQNKELEGKDQYQAFANALMGPLGSQIAGLFTATKMYQDGAYARAIESMSPAAIRNIIAAARMENEGVKTIKGDPIVNRDLTMTEIANKVLGFNPTVVTNNYDANTAVAKARDRIAMKKAHLVNRYIASNPQERVDLMRGDIKDFNSEVEPQERITIGGLMKSIRQRKALDRRTENGLYLSKKSAHLRDIGRFGKED